MTTEDQTIAFIQRHRTLLAREREAEIERSSLLLSNCGPKLLEQKGLALGGLGVSSIRIGLGGKTSGDLARIEENVSATTSKKSNKGKKGAESSQSARAAEGVVAKVTDVRIVIAIDTSDSNEELDLPERCRVVKLANSVTYDRMEKTLNQLEKVAVPSNNSSGDKSTPQQTHLTRVLLGQSKPSEKVPIQELTFFDSTLNQSQKEAVKFVLESPEVGCIHGPPGTGKTHTLIEVIRQLTTVTPSNPKPSRLLICGASNLSVDNILERLLALPSPENGSERLKVTRVGHPARVMAHEGVLESTLEVKAGRSGLARDVKNELEAALDTLSGKGKGTKGKAPRGLERKKMWEEVRALRKEYRQREGGVVESVLGESQVVLATCHSAGGRQLRNQSFDVAIIDEATQALEAVCWIPIFKTKKLILAGDPKQLPPTILSDNIKRKKDSKIAGKSSGSQSKPQIVTKPQISADKSQSDDPDVSDEAEDESDPDEEPSQATQPPSKSKPINNTPRKVKPLLRPPRSLETTLFDRLEKMYGNGIKRMLTVQYRMHAQIVSFPSKTMYRSKLTSHDSVSSHLLRDLPNTQQDQGARNDDKETLETPVVFFDTAGCEYFERSEGDGDEGSKCNENEVTVVKNWIEQLVVCGVLPSQIAVITPYQAQVTLLTSVLRPIYGLDLEIGTVDGMQGREKDAVIITLVRSNDQREVGFLKDKRRLNVAMTRAKRHLCVVGDSSTVQHGSPFLKKWMNWLENNADVRYAGLE
ncbi:hypothetical protein NLI96_g6993 [Meripilus lineatus]|uniref:DNA helicase n=1 Tax=Meripilus lineatus TaxID=2056292 RepID=A0AAD5V006_9APHY|nr:hypothetical protein NLI96_g6993 [Physisporinus lineatus]